MEFTYSTIKELAKQTGRRVTDLIALAAQNDPFYTGTPGEVTLGEWFADFYHRTYPRGTHVHARRCHYHLVSVNATLPSGKPYENTMECWDTLLMATKAARYLRLVDVSLFEDRKHDDPVSYASADYDPSLSVHENLYTSNLQVPDFPDFPNFAINDYDARQPYHLEMWCEKTTMNDILLPLCQEYGAVLQTGAGELSITATKALAERISERGKPARIFYISDYDPAGQSMPVAVARKLEYFIRSEHLNVDVRLFPVVLTAEQVRAYGLPRTPIKESERRKEAFEARHGQGATELDALEAQRPGELRRVLRRCIEHYYDNDLDQQTRWARARLADDLRALRRQVAARYADRIADHRAELAQIVAEYGPRMEAYANRLRQTWEEIAEEMRENTPEIDDYPRPDGQQGDELDEGLYNSERSYLEQIDAYKRFQGKASGEEDEA